MIFDRNCQPIQDGCVVLDLHANCLFLVQSVYATGTYKSRRKFTISAMLFEGVFDVVEFGGFVDGYCDTEFEVLWRLS